MLNYIKPYGFYIPQSYVSNYYPFRHPDAGCKFVPKTDGPIPAPVKYGIDPRDAGINN